MSGQNGNGNGAPKPEKSQMFDENGLFVKGCPPGPGRPKGSLDFLQICKRRAREVGIDLEELVWAAARGLALKAARGDAAAGKIILDRLCGAIEKPAEVKVEIDARTTIEAGPPMPPDGEFGAYAIKLLEVTAAQGLLPEPLDPDVEALL